MAGKYEAAIHVRVTQNKEIKLKNSELRCAHDARVTQNRNYDHLSECMCLRVLV